MTDRTVFKQQSFTMFAYAALAILGAAAAQAQSTNGTQATALDIAAVQAHFTRMSFPVRAIQRAE
jgi:hypothetical protein